MKTLLIRALIVWLAGTLPVRAEIYRSTDENGHVVFSDQHSPDAEAITIPQTNTLPPTTSDRSGIANPKDETLTVPYDQVAILTPEPDQAIVSTGGPLSVNLMTTPALRRGHSVELLVDGNLGASGVDNHFALADLLRGTHSLIARIIDRDGNIVATSDAVQFHIIIPGGAGRAR